MSQSRRVLFEDANVLQHELGAGFYNYKQPLVNEVTDDPPSTVEEKIQQESETREQENVRREEKIQSYSLSLSLSPSLSLLIV